MRTKATNDEKRRFSRLRRRWGRRSGTWWWATLVVVLPVALITAAALITLLTFVDVGHDARDRIEVIKIGLTVGAGTGGIVALVLTGRRQWATEHDNRERRLTELYVKAVEQLGSDKAPVRHGGMYALARVGQDNPDQRQNVVDVLCAYLRGPYTPLGEATPLRLGLRRPLLRTRRSEDRGTGSAARDIPKLPARSEVEDEARQEREVRLTAQRLLARHLDHGDQEHPPSTFWADMNIDLAGATLIDFALSSFRVNEAIFTRAKFTGDAWFGGAKFGGDAVFDEVQFDGYAGFIGVKFDQHAEFGGAKFRGDAGFGGAKFGGETGFAEAMFHGHAEFDEAEFDGDAGFGWAKFGEFAGFNVATFRGHAVFGGAKFGGFAWLSGARFDREAWFDEARFSGDAKFVGTTFSGYARFDEARFDREAWFDGTTFSTNASFEGAEFSNGTPAELPSHLASHLDETRSLAAVDDGGSAPDV